MKTTVDHYRKPLPQWLTDRLLEINKQADDPSFDLKRAQEVFVAFQGKVVVGFAILNRPHGYWYFRNCVVDRKYRGGVQNLLIKARLDFVRSQGGTKVSVGVFPKNYRSLNNLIANGFKFAGMVKNPKIGEYQLLVWRTN